jgi:hypothetical protein
MRNGVLRDYAPRLPQKERMPLVCKELFLCSFEMMSCFQISDVINALIYLQSLNFLATNSAISGVREAYLSFLELLPT